MLKKGGFVKIPGAYYTRGSNKQGCSITAKNVTEIKWLLATNLYHSNIATFRECMCDHSDFLNDGFYLQAKVSHLISF